MAIPSGPRGRQTGGLLTKPVLSTLAVLAAWTAGAPPAAAETMTVCYKSGTELDFSSASMQNSRAKLENPVYFGPGGAVAPETLAFAGLGTITRTGLNASGCDIFIGGGFNGSLSVTEGGELVSWAQNDGGFVIGGCDSATNQTCAAFGRSLTQIGNPGVQLSTALAYNPLTCGGVGSVGTFGGVAAVISMQAGDAKLAEFADGTGNAASTTDDLIEPTFLFTADADMYGSSGAGAVGAGATATTNQAIFVLNAFKYALDGIQGRLVNPDCPVDYNSSADLELSLSLDETSIVVGAAAVATLTIENKGPNDVAGAEALLTLPAGLVVLSASGDGTFDGATGTWNAGAIANGAVRTIDVTLSATAEGNHTVAAEITQTSLPDPDSAPNASFGEDDKGDSFGDDDEATASLDVTSTPPNPVVSGLVFEDNGASGGAHDGTPDAGETGLAGVTVEALDTGGTVIAATMTAGDGTYRLVLPPGAAGTIVSIRTALAGAGWRHISEGPGALAGLVNASEDDGQLSFTPMAGTDYGNVDFGQLREPQMQADRVASTFAGGVVQLAHVYTATTSGEVSFGLAGQMVVPDGAFSAGLFHDGDCSGTLDAGEDAVSGAIAVVAGDQVCVVARLAVATGAPAGAETNFEVTAETALDGIGTVLALTNSDRVAVGGAVEMAIVKDVRNVSAGGSFGSVNQARPGAILEYRLRFRNPGSGQAFDVEVTDKTPAYTSLEGASALVVAPPAGMSCVNSVPGGGGGDGYTGALAWVCTGTMAPGGAGEIRFQVQVDP